MQSFVSSDRVFWIKTPRHYCTENIIAKLVKYLNFIFDFFYKIQDVILFYLDTDTPGVVDFSGITQVHLSGSPLAQHLLTSSWPTLQGSLFDPCTCTGTRIRGTQIFVIFKIQPVQF